MGLTVAAINITVQKRISTFGELIQIIKYTTGVVSARYKQRKKTYDDAEAISIKAIVAMDPTVDMVSATGHSGPAAGMLTLCRLDLEIAFPGVAIMDTVSKDDHVEVLGKRWRIIATHYTGQMSGQANILVVLFDHLEGRKDEAFP